MVAAQRTARTGYTGLWIDMLGIGDADCILVSRWRNGVVKRVLIDGGEKKHAAYIRAFLRRRGVRHIHHLVCSHLHRDHAAGLIELVKDRSLSFDCAWVLRPEENVNMEEVNEALAATAGNRVSDFLLESLRTQQTLVEWLESR